MRSIRLLGRITATVAVGSAQVLNPLYTSTQYSEITTQPLDITDLFNNRGFGTTPGDADFDGNQSKDTGQLLSSWKSTR
jgi:hypothetical protein